jgi:hypothetical protein
MDMTPPDIERLAAFLDVRTRPIAGTLVDFSPAEWFIEF